MHFRVKQKYEFLANEKNVGRTSGGSFVGGSFVGNERDSDVAVMKVYDQSDFIAKREEHIIKLNKY